MDSLCHTNFYIDTLEYLIKNDCISLPVSLIRNFETDIWIRINLLNGIREVKEKESWVERENMKKKSRYILNIDLLERSIGCYGLDRRSKSYLSILLPINLNL